MTYRDLIPTTRDIVQIVFFVTIALVTVLTYLKAKRTLLQPIRTEIFKEQLKIFTSLLEMFSGKGEYELREDFHFEELIYANIISLLDSYGRVFFELDIDESKRPYRPELCPLARMSPNMLVKADWHLQPAEHDAPRAKLTAQMKADKWKGFEFGMICIPVTLSAQMTKLGRLSASPLIPQELSQLLDLFNKTIDKNIDAIGKVLIESAKELPQKYPDLNAFGKASTVWLRNRYNQNFEGLQSQAEKITAYLRSYFKVESIME